jgi:hypothetical protein
LFELGREDGLAFPVKYKGNVLTTVGDAVDVFSKLSNDQVDQPYWHRALITMNTATKCRQYLKVATINLQTAIMMENF